MATPFTSSTTLEDWPVHSPSVPPPRALALHDLPMVHRFQAPLAAMGISAPTKATILPKTSAPRESPKIFPSLFLLSLALPSIPQLSPGPPSIFPNFGSTPSIPTRTMLSPSLPAKDPRGSLSLISATGLPAFPAPLPHQTSEVTISRSSQLTILVDLPTRTTESMSSPLRPPSSLTNIMRWNPGNSSMEVARMIPAHQPTPVLVGSKEMAGLGLNS